MIATSLLTSGDTSISAGKATIQLEAQARLQVRIKPSEIPIACTVAIIDTSALMKNERNSGIRNGPAHDAGKRKSRCTFTFTWIVFSQLGHGVG